MKIGLIITVWKRNNLELQIKQILKQTLRPDYVVVFQNENHINVDNIVKKYNCIHVKSSYNTKYFGRFSYMFNLPVDICIVMDDDIIPNINCIKNYSNLCINHNSIIGGNGRYSFSNPNYNILKTKTPKEGLRKLQLVDFVGHLWCFKKEWLHYMFSIKPYTYDTGEDMHLCFSCKLLGNINSYVGQHNCIEDNYDNSNGSLGDDAVACFKVTSPELRKNVEKYFLDKGIQFVNI